MGFQELGADFYSETTLTEVHTRVLATSSHRAFRPEQERHKDDSRDGAIKPLESLSILYSYPSPFADRTGELRRLSFESVPYMKADNFDVATSHRTAAQVRLDSFRNQLVYRTVRTLRRRMRCIGPSSLRLCRQTRWHSSAHCFAIPRVRVIRKSTPAMTDYFAAEIDSKSVADASYMDLVRLYHCAGLARQ